MIVNKIYGTKPVLAHAPGRLPYIPLWKDVTDFAREYKVKTKLPEEVSVVTFNNENPGCTITGKKLGALEACLDRSEVPYTVLGRDEKEWKNRKKITLLRDHLETVGSKYVIVADSSDVFLVGKFEGVVESFLGFGCDAVFNGEKSLWPLDQAEHLVKFEKGLHPTKFFNAGLWIAKTDFAKELVEFCDGVQPETKYVNSEQARYKYAYHHFYPKIRVDFGCRIFQDLNRTGHDEVGFVKLIV